MCTLGGNAHGGAAAGETLVTEDFLGLPHHFHLFLGVAVALKTVDVWNDVEGQGMGKNLIGKDLPLQRLPRPLLQFCHPLRASSTGGLVGRNDDFFQLEVLVQRPERHSSNGRGAVGVRDQQLAIHRRLIDLWNHQRHILMISEGAGVVNDHGLAIARNLRGELSTEAARDCHQHKVTGLRSFHAKGLYLLLSVGRGHALAS
mmetsp:Transcript_61638/g.135031  ORF Transcript_61638/g.135031 Transcript_61638/m.135031 type:complete len:202 (+) Transcript_61638:298-903(+)